ncbi:MAG: hypothetical protein KBT09_03885 [Bacteroidales bacterium]|nr:hypothetical protein [Candidatus Sodaliphilus fimicaballi]
MKKILLALALILAVAVEGNCGITVGVTMPLLESERNMLPDKTIEASLKEVKYKTSNNLTASLDSLMNIVVENAIMWRTFSLNINNNGENYEVSILQIDPTVSSNDYLGPYIKGHCHFLVVQQEENKDLINSLFKRDGEKVKYVREFEFVEDKDCIQSTNVEAIVTPNEVKVSNCIVEGIDINEENSPIDE